MGGSCTPVMGFQPRCVPYAAEHDGDLTAGDALPRARAPTGKQVLLAPGTAPCAPCAPGSMHGPACSPCSRRDAHRRLPSSSSSAVMDLERSVRVVLGALLGGGGAERKRDGILHFLSRNLRGVARCRCHFFSTAWISSYSRDEESHCCRILLRLRVEANFFMVSVAQSGGTGPAPVWRGRWLPQAPSALSKGGGGESKSCPQLYLPPCSYWRCYERLSPISCVPGSCLPACLWDSATSSDGCFPSARAMGGG